MTTCPKCGSKIVEPVVCPGCSNEFEAVSVSESDARAIAAFVQGADCHSQEMDSDAIGMSPRQLKYWENCALRLLIEGKLGKL